MDSHIEKVARRLTPPKGNFALAEVRLWQLPKHNLTHRPLIRPFRRASGETTGRADKR